MLSTAADYSTASVFLRFLLHVWVGSTLVLLMLLPVRVVGQSFPTLIYSTENGMPNDMVYDVAQDDIGAIWLATRGGLLRFDGLEWTITRQLERQFDTIVGGVEVTNRGNLWVSGKALQLGLAYSGNQGRTWSFVNGPQGWRGSIRDFKIVPSSPETAVVVTERGDVFCHTGGTWTKNEQFGFDFRRAYDIQTFGDGIAVATSVGISVLADGRWHHGFLDSECANGQPVYAIASDERDGSMWLIQDGQLRKASGKSCHTVLNDSIFRNARINMISDGTDGVWIGTHDGVVHYDSLDGLSHYNRSTGLTANGASAMLRDRDNHVWIAHLRGLSCIPSLRFASYRESDGLFDDEVTAIIETPCGGLVFGHVGGLSLMQNGKISRLPLPNGGYTMTNARRVLDMAADADGNIWVAQHKVGIVRVKPNGKARVYQHPDLDSAAGVCVDRTGQVWAAGTTGIFQLIDDQLVKVRAKGLPEPLVARRILELQDGRLCLTTSRSGLYLLQDGRWRNIRHAGQADANDTYSVLETDTGVLLVGTQGGLYRVSGDQIVPGPYGPDSSDAVYSILRDDKDRFWYGTRRGMVRYDKRGAFRFTVDQGLVGNEVNRSATLLDSRGLLWFGTSRGVTRYRREHDLGEMSSPYSEIRGIEVDGDLLTSLPDLDLGHDENNLRFLFHAINFGSGNSVEYRARLEGFDTKWLTGNEVMNGFVRYTNLPSGSYRFTVQARRNQGRWGPLSSTNEIVIRRPFWKTAWFYAVVIVGVLGIVLGAIEFLVTRRRNEELDRMVNARTAELNRAKERYRDIFEKNKLPQLLVDVADGMIVGVNQAAIDFFGYPREELQGKGFSRIFDDTEIEKRISNSSNLRSFEGNTFQYVASGKIRHIQFYASIYELQGRRIAQLSVFDVTEKESLQQQLFQAQKMECMGRIAGGIAHDFNNLLTTVLLNSYLAGKETGVPEQVHCYIEGIRKAGECGARLTKQLLGFARKQAASPRITNVNELLLDIEAVLRRIVHEGIEFRFNHREDVGNVHIDPVQLEQILVNLVVNASDAMGDTGVLTLETGRVSLKSGQRIGGPDLASENYVVISVSDNGAGMDRETREHAFEPFFTTKEGGRGTGLGLSTCHGIAKQNDGHIVINSEVGFGSTVKVFLPQIDSPAERPEDITESEIVAGGETILLVEDDDSVRDVVADILRHAGYTVLEASSSAMAEEVYMSCKDPIDILVTDVIMPGGSGAELYQNIVKMDDRIRVLFLSGYTCSALGSNGLNLDKMPLLEKPFLPNELLRKVCEVAISEPGFRAIQSSSLGFGYI